jgi:hypothetical protein
MGYRCAITKEHIQNAPQIRVITQRRPVIYTTYYTLRDREGNSAEVDVKESRGWEIVQEIPVSSVSLAAKVFDPIDLPEVKRVRVEVPEPRRQYSNEEEQ